MNWPKLLLSSFFFLSLAYAQGLPEQFMKKPYVEIKTEKTRDSYHHKYTFKDERGDLQSWQWSVNAKHNDYIGGQFGIDPRHMVNGGVKASAVANSYFVEEGKYIRPDYSGLVNLYARMTKPIYDKMKSHFDERNLNIRQQLEMILRFLQDYPYGVVPMTFNGMFVSGLMPMTEIFKTGWSDCDSKSVLMAAILAHHPVLHNKLAIIEVPEHALLGVEAIPRPYEDHVSYLGKKYIYAEPVGSIRSPFGKTNSPYTRSIKVHPIKVFYEGESENKKESAVAIADTITESDCPDGGILISFISPVTGGKNLMCRLKKDGNYVSHGPTILYNKDGTIHKKQNFVLGVEQ